MTLSFWIAIIIPLIGIASYVFYIIKSKSDSLSYEDADMAYYIGFMLTIIILIFTIAGTKFSADNTELLLNKFAAGIFSTFIGLAARLYIIYLINKIPTTTTEAMIDIVAELRNFLSEMKFQFSDVSSSANEMSSSFKTMNSDIKKMITSINSSVQKLDIESKVLAVNEQLDTSLKTITDTVNKMSTITTTTSENITKSFNALNALSNETLNVVASVEAANHSFDSISKKIDDNLSTSINSASDSLVKLSNSNHIIVDKLVETSNQLNHAQNILKDLQSTPKEHIELLKDINKNIQELIKKTGHSDNHSTFFGFGGR